MNRELKTKWLEALRSGKYKQGRSALRTIQDEFCCLGVLCDIVAPDAWSKPAPSVWSSLVMTKTKSKVPFLPRSTN